MLWDDDIVKKCEVLVHGIYFYIFYSFIHWFIFWSLWVNILLQRSIISNNSSPGWPREAEPWELQLPKRKKAFWQPHLLWLPTATDTGNEFFIKHFFWTKVFLLTVYCLPNLLPSSYLIMSDITWRFAVRNDFVSWRLFGNIWRYFWLSLLGGDAIGIQWVEARDAATK